MEQGDDIKSLLGEIRDLQKAHFERYKQFTEAMLQSQHAARQQEEQLRQQYERQQEETLARISRGQLRAMIGIVVVLVVSTLAIGAVVVAIHFWSQMPPLK